LRDVITFKPVGIVHTTASDDMIREGTGIVSIVEIYPEFENALEGIDGFSHLFILGYFHKLRPEQVGPLQVKPRRLLRRGYSLDARPLLGVFALDSPTRPNPIGLTLVPLLKREGRRLFVTGLDHFDGTPVLDIKPYQPDYHRETYQLPDWYVALMDDAGHV
jgi:tRNA-Thr(GGU) m(6)t(6)A37 methyltransferase TsaA